MRLIITVTDTDGATIHSDAWHLPHDLAHWLTPTLTSETRTWTGSALPIAVPDRFAEALLDGDGRLGLRWTIEHCACLSCRIPAKARQQEQRRRGGVESHG